MAVSPINISRVTLRSNLAMDSLRANQREVFLNQSRISSGRSFAVPSENPSAASQAFGFHNLQARQLQLLQNIQLGGSVLREADNAINEVNALLIDAQTIASQNLSNLTTADERAAAAELVAAIRQQLITVGNRTFNGRYIFAGRQTQSAPFVDALGGVAYLGDTGRLDIRVSQGLLESINIPGNELFGALSSSVAGLVDLSPDLTEDVRLEDLRGDLHAVRRLDMNDLRDAPVVRKPFVGWGTSNAACILLRPLQINIRRLIVKGEQVGHQLSVRM